MREQNDRISIAYMRESLAKADPKKFPKLERLLIKPADKARPQYQDPEARWRSHVAASRRPTKH